MPRPAGDTVAGGPSAWITIGSRTGPVGRPRFAFSGSVPYTFLSAHYDHHASAAVAAAALSNGVWSRLRSDPMPQMTDQ